MSVFLYVSGGEHDRIDCPVTVPIDVRADLPSGPFDLVDRVSQARFPAQLLGDRLLFILERLGRGESRAFTIEAGEPLSAGVRATENAGVLEVTIDGAPFTSYNFDPSEVRPYFFPLLGPTGVAMTRSYPMVEDVAGESTDHPHHRSLYVAFGEVSGVDVWAEPPHPNTGRIVHQGWNERSDGAAATHWRESLLWVDGQDTALLDEQRVVTIYNTTSIRLLELEVTLTPARLAVLFGDTKEGGPLALRVASAIEGKRGGLIQNAFGGRRESETWGKRAPWVDYSGAIDGTTVGVAILDHPTSFRHPTWWHVRDYGLFAANPFGLSAFTGDPSRRGDHVLVPGQSIAFRYRVCLHRGDADAANLADRYHDYANPPIAEWLAD